MISRRFSASRFAAHHHQLSAVNQTLFSVVRSCSCVASSFVKQREAERPPRNIVSPADVAKRTIARGNNSPPGGGGGDGAAAVAGADGNAAATHSTTETTPRKKLPGGVQKEALQLYRALLRATSSQQRADTSLWDVTINKKQNSDDAQVDVDGVTPKQKRARRGVVFQLNQEQRFVQESFRKHQHIPRRSMDKIEWHLHHARSKLEELKENSSNRTGFSVLTFE